MLSFKLYIIFVSIGNLDWFNQIWFNFCSIITEWDDKEGKEALQQWEDDWDDDDVNDDFSLQLRKELESKSEKSS